MTRSAGSRRSGSSAVVTARTWACGSSRPGQPSATEGKAARPNSRASSEGCCPVRTSVGVTPCASSARATGFILMASGLVPMTSLMSAKRSLPPTSAEGDCLRYGRSSTKIVGVGLELEAHRCGGHDMVLKPVLVAVGDCRVLRLEGDAHLRPRVARSIPAGERVRAEGLLPLELQQPLAGIGLAGLRGLALELRDARDGHHPRRWQS